MGACGAQTHRLFIHHIRKRFNAARNMDCNGSPGIIARRKHKTIKKLLQRQRVSWFNTAQRCPRFRVDSVLRSPSLIATRAVIIFVMLAGYMRSKTSLL